MIKGKKKCYRILSLAHTFHSHCQSCSCQSKYSKVILVKIQLFYLSWARDYYWQCSGCPNLLTHVTHRQTWDKMVWHTLINQHYYNKLKKVRKDRWKNTLILLVLEQIWRSLHSRNVSKKFYIFPALTLSRVFFSQQSRLLTANLNRQWSTTHLMLFWWIGLWQGLQKHKKYINMLNVTIM